MRGWSSRKRIGEEREKRGEDGKGRREKRDK